MIGLASFGGTVHGELGREQFLAFYTTAAVLASLVSHTATVAPLLTSVVARQAMAAGRSAALSLTCPCCQKSQVAGHGPDVCIAKTANR